MRLGQIGYVDVIADAGAVWCRIIGTKYLNRFPFSGGNIQNQWNQMGLRIVIFADLRIRIGAGGIKITLNDKPVIIPGESGQVVTMHLP